MFLLIFQSSNSDQLSCHVTLSNLGAYGALILCVTDFMNKVKTVG